jgi:hypothetical protein
VSLRDIVDIYLFIAIIIVMPVAAIVRSYRNRYWLSTTLWIGIPIAIVLTFFFIFDLFRTISFIDLLTVAFLWISFYIFLPKFLE